jgi:hypothetical protein
MGKAVKTSTLKNIMDHKLRTFYYTKFFKNEKI